MATVTEDGMVILHDDDFPTLNRFDRMYCKLAGKIYGIRSTRKMVRDTKKSIKEDREAFNLGISVDEYRKTHAIVP